MLLPLMLAGCATHFTNLSPRQLGRTENNQYPVEVVMNSQQQTLRWDSIRVQAVVGDKTYPMRQTRMMKNRWEGYIPVPPGVTTVRYCYKFDYEYNSFGAPKTESVLTPEYILHVNPQQ
jgi:hypothetical protein